MTAFFTHLSRLSFALFIFNHFLTFSTLHKKVACDIMYLTKTDIYFYTIMTH